MLQQCIRNQSLSLLYKTDYRNNVLQRPLMLFYLQLRNFNKCKFWINRLSLSICLPQSKSLVKKSYEFKIWTITEKSSSHESLSNPFMCHAYHANAVLPELTENYEGHNFNAFHFLYLIAFWIIMWTKIWWLTFLKEKRNAWLLLYVYWMI